MFGFALTVVKIFTRQLVTVIDVSLIINVSLGVLNLFK